MSVITEVYAREILDSRGNPTVEADVMVSLRTAISILWVVLLEAKFLEAQ